MELEKNLHAKIPASLLTEAEKVARAEHITVDELVQDAMERRVRDHRRQKLRTHGGAQARKLGVETEDDVERVVHEYREEQRLGKHREPGR